MNNNYYYTNGSGLRPARIRTLAAATWWAVVLGIVACLAPLSAEEVLQVEESQALEAAVSKPQPVFPSVARQLRLSGKAVVEATVDEQGKVADCKPVSGNPLFTAAAVSAVKTWKFKPFTSGGKPARAVAKLTFAFSL